MKIKLTKYELTSLILMIIIPFFLIVIALLPYSDGVHGTTYSYGGNDYEFDGEITDDNRHFKGDLFIDENTGWVFCNGKVRFSGELNIKNADLDYTVRDRDHFGSMFDTNYQEITLDGTEGEMEEGIPFYFLGLIGSMIGFLIWCSWYISKNKKNETEANVWKIRKAILTGIIILNIAIYLLIWPSHYKLLGNEYNATWAIGSIFFGIFGSIISSLLIGYGIGQMRFPKKRNISS